MNSQAPKLLGKILIVILVINNLASFPPVLTTALAQKNRIIVVNAEQPNVWTLEQAHYLLAQMRQRNLDLRAKRLEDLDANEINGLQFDVLRTLVELGVEFNDANRVTNRLLGQNRNFNSSRRQTLLARRDTLSDKSANLTGEITGLQIEKARAKSQEDKDRLDAEIAAKTSQRDAVDKQVESIDNELKTLNEPTGDFKETIPQVNFDPNKLPKSVFDEAFTAAAKQQIENFNKAPQLNATLRLENFLQMQYEIIAKQLTLLRDEVGPGERLLFLELPQTVNVTSNEGNNKWAQSWWRIAGYMRRKQVDVDSVTAAALARATPTPAPAQNQKPITIAQDYNYILNNENIIIKRDIPEVKGEEKPAGRYVRYVNEFVNLGKIKLPPELESPLADYKDRLDNRMVRTVDLIPRQSSLNVNDMKLRVKSGMFSFVASFLFGFGSRLNVQRQREQFSQFVQQELYSSAFGKGAREFGWTFTPMPGTDRLLSGTRTTYAAVIVPEEATSLLLESNGCYFPRDAYQPNNFDDTKVGRWNVDNRTSRNCGEGKAFLVSIPNGGADGMNDFWVRGVSYNPVKKGERIVVLISGSNFSSQIGVLVNGVPLVPAVGLAQPLIRDDSDARRDALLDLKGEKVSGNIERVDANKIVFSFEIPDFEGTPTITLVAPGKSIDINWLDNISVNEFPLAILSGQPKPEKRCTCGKKPPDCVERAPWMFGVKPEAVNFKIDSMEAFLVGDGFIKVLIHGAGFAPEPSPPSSCPTPTPAPGATPTPTPTPAPSPVRKLYINGVDQPFDPISPALIEVKPFKITSGDKIQATLVYGTDTIRSESINNPARLSITGTEVIVFEAATEEEPATLVVKITGTGFTDKLKTSLGEIAVKSATEAILTITSPKAAATVTLTDEDTGQQVRTVITRRTRSPD